MFTQPKAILYQFYFSHYCEKARWALDWKGIGYEEKNLLPGQHLHVAKKLGLSSSSVPILNYKGKLIQDSTAIIDALDGAISKNPLTPQDENLKKEALELEEFFDAVVGPAIRRWMYSFLLPDRKLATRLMTDHGPWYSKLLYAFLFPTVRSHIQKHYKVDSTSLAKAEHTLDQAFETINPLIKQSAFLVGKQFSRADLTAAALLAPLCMPLEHPVTFPEENQLPAVFGEYRREKRKEPFFQWVLDVYRAYR